MKRSLCLILIALLLAGCANKMLPTEAPENGSIVRLSHIQGSVGIPPASGIADTCQVVILGDPNGCVVMEREGCKVNTCEVGSK